MEKELLTIEFRYTDKDGEYHSKTITIGVYDTLDIAIEEGNKIINKLSETFEVRSEWWHQGSHLDDKFQKTFLFGCPKRLVTNTCYSTKGVQYFAQITKLEYRDVSETIEEIFNSK
jgi:hypothetical protein